ncbi:S-layer homology domain-containing protein [Pseudoflavonifractor sp. 524-17]|uniref:S-layer homology domain-containing protein n=1 Tax=Pseudoflavonifractor sp. 524-17 TaxID=2304577 RepID=UPI001379AA62|nr:S-layer homology domain-containing protein [Pseudoflavonifractor sp. 524-17]
MSLKQNRRRWAQRLAAGLLSLTLAAGLVPAQAVDWAQEHLDKLSAWNILRGDIDGNLYSDRNITRAEFVSMVNRAYGYDQAITTPFTDVDSRAWYADDIGIAYNMGYFHGTSRTTASPENNLTREEAVILLSRNMMLRGETGETLGFTDSRNFSEWSRGLIQAASDAGIITGYPDGSFRPQNEITRGEVACMISNAIGTPVPQPGEYELGNVYGNVTISTSGVTLRNTTIAGDLYLTGGIELGDVLLENVNVLGKIVASGAGEANKGDHSIILRNIQANEMIVDSIDNQFTTVRVEGDTFINTTSVRTSAYLEDMTAEGMGMKYIELDGDRGISLQLTGNIKEVLNLSPTSRLAIAQGSAEKITIDEKAAGAALVIENDARVKELNLDVATSVTGTGDVDHLNVNAAGSTVETLPDSIIVRPGITADINKETMDNVAAAESSEDPILLAGYPAARDVASTSANAVFSTNKKGTIYWTVSALADGSIDEDDVITPPTYASKILKSGNLPAEKSRTEYTAKISGLTTNGSYYLTAVMVDARGQRSPVKVTAFTTPDDTVPAFATGYPTMSRITNNSAQVTVMTNKNCLVYYALLPKGSVAPTAADFKTAAIPGNLGYGSRDAVKNSTLPFTVNDIDLEELETYDLYLWLTDYDGAKSSGVQKITFTTVDKTPPVVRYMNQTGAQATSVTMSSAMNEPGTIYWAVVKQGETFFRPLTGQTVAPAPSDDAAKSQVKSGLGALRNGRQAVGQAEADITINISGLEGETAYDLYYVGEDSAGNFSAEVQKVTINTLDNNPPTVKQEFTRFNGEENEDGTITNLMPLGNTDIRLVFSESVQGMETVQGERRYNKFMELYQEVERTSGQQKEQARELLADALQKHIQMWVKPVGGRPEPVIVRPRERTEDNAEDYDTNWVIDFRYATVTLENGGMVITFPTETGLNLATGETYYFTLSGIADTSDAANLMSNQQLPDFTIAFATVNISPVNEWKIDEYLETDGRPTTPATPLELDMVFQLDPHSTSNTADGMFYDLMLWSDSNLEFDLYARNNESSGIFGTWEKQGTFSYTLQEREGNFVYRTTAQMSGGSATSGFKPLTDLKEGCSYQYAIRVTRLSGKSERDTWNKITNFKVTVAAGGQSDLRLVTAGGVQTDWENALSKGVYSIGVPDPYAKQVAFSDKKAPETVSPYPQFTPQDTTAEMSFLLNREGTVYYLVTPVTLDANGKVSTPVPPQAVVLDDDGQIIPGSEFVPFPEEVPDSGTDTSVDNNPLYLSVPTKDIIINGNITERTVRKGQIANDGASTCTVSLKDLTPNTTYYVYVMYQGTQQVVSDYAMCYKFTTVDVIRPILTLTISNGDSSKVDVEVDRTSDVTARLLYTGNIPAPFSDPFYRYVDSAKVPPTANKVWMNQDGSPNENYTVLDAMENSIGGRGTCSVFDAYATDTISREIANAIRAGTIGGSAMISQWQGTLPMGGSDTMSFDLPDPDATYVCVAVATSTEGGESALRAARPVQIVDRDAPVLISADPILEIKTDPANPDRKFASGILTLNYDKYLYRVYGGTPYPMTSNPDKGVYDAPSSDGVTYCGMQNLFPENIFYKPIGSSTATGRINQITLEIKDLPLSDISIAIPNALYNKTGVQAKAYSVKISYNESTGKFTTSITEGKS